MLKSTNLQSLDVLELDRQLELVSSRFIDCEVKEAEPTLSLLPSVLTDYLDLLLNKKAECPEQSMTRFECLQCQMGDYPMLIPLSRIRRIEKCLEQPALNLIEVPECEGRVNFLLKLNCGRKYLPVQALKEILWIESEDIKWRDTKSTGGLISSPWFVGTHPEQLCRLFDPDLFLTGEVSYVDYS